MNLTLSDVYNEPASMVSRIFENTFVLLQIFMAPLLFYVTMTQSKQMELYRFYLMNTVVWNTIVEITLALISPAFLSPYTCIIFNGFLVNFFSVDILYRLFEIFMFGSINTVISIIFTLLYRLFTLLNITKMIDLFGNWKFFIGLLSIGQLLGLFCIYLLESFKPFIYSQENYMNIIQELPFLDEELIMQRTICMPFEINRLKNLKKG
jgi:hypothetical protein